MNVIQFSVCMEKQWDESTLAAGNKEGLEWLHHARQWSQVLGLALHFQQQKDFKLPLLGHHDARSLPYSISLYGDDCQEWPNALQWSHTIGLLTVAMSPETLLLIISHKSTVYWRLPTQRQAPTHSWVCMHDGNCA